MAADERIITELIIQGAEQSVRQIESVAASTTGLVTIQEQAGVRQREVYDSVARAAEQAEKTQIQASNLVLDAERRNAEELARIEAQKTNIVVEAAKKRDAARQGPTDVFGTQATTQARAELNTNLRQNTATGQSFADVSLASRQAQALAGAINQEAQAAQTLQSRLAALASTIRQVVTENLSLSRSTEQVAVAQRQQAESTQRTQSGSISYLSVLSAIHAASFLATNQTFSLLGSFVTLGAAFGKVGLAAGAFGLALGGVLAIFGQINQAAQLIQQTVIGVGETLLKFGVGATIALGAAGAAGVHAAADIETQLAGVRAFGGATTDQLAQVATLSQRLALDFGVAAADSVKATSLFAQAGGSVDDALKGATEAIVKFKLASEGAGQATIGIDQAAVAVSAGIKQFSLTGEDAIRVVDNLTAASQASALSFTGVTQAFVQAAPGAAALGISIEDLSAAIAIIGDQLIKGTLTGTAFKQAIIDLINPSKQAQEVFNKYGITIHDANNNILPLIDIVTNLNAALGDEAVATGKVGTAERERALAQIGGARAFLAFNILTRQGGEGLEDYRQKLSQLSANNIVDVLLLPLNKQLEILATTVQVVGQAFGGPLLQPIRAATVTAIDFFKQTIPFANLLGEAVSSVVTGQGFEALQIQIDALVGHNNLSSFLIEVVNSFRNVREVIVDQIIPAIAIFINTISQVGNENGRIDDVGKAFEELNKNIQFIGATIATTIVAFGNLLAQMIHNEGAGKDLRETISTLADAIINRLVAGLLSTAAAVAAAFALMPAFAKSALIAAQISLGFAKALLVLNNSLIEVARNVSIVITVLDAFVQNEMGNRTPLIGLKDSLSDIITKSAAMSAENQKNIDTIDGIRTAVNNLANGDIDKVIDGIKNAGKAEIDAAGTAKKSISEIVDEIVRAEGINVELLTESDVATLIERAGAIKTAAVGSINPIVSTFENARGQLTGILDSIIADVAKTQRELQTGPSAGGPGVQFVDEKALKSQVDKIDAAGRDLSVRLANISEDAGQKVTNSVASALAKVTDIFEAANQRLDDLKDQTALRIKEINDRLAERQADRAVLDPFKKAQEDRLTEFTRELDKEDQAQERSLDHQKTARARDTEDVNRNTQQQFENVATGYQRMQQAAEIAFQQIQQARTTAFERGQEVEATAFQRAQQAASDARDFAKQLANTKPADQANLIKQHNDALADTKFKQGQENDLTKFRQNQEDKKLEFTRTTEATALSFRITQENQLTDFRRAQEVLIQSFRRELEDKEIGIREGEEDAALGRRLAREDILTARRRKDAQDLRDFEDTLERNKADAQIAEIVEKANIEGNKIIRNAGEHAAAVLEALNLDFDKQTAELEKQLRNAQESLDKLRDSVPPELLDAVQARLAAVQASLNAAKDSARASVSQAQEAARLNVDQAIAVGNAQLAVRPPVATLPAITQTQIPLGVLTAQTIQVSNLVLPNGFSNAVSQAVLLGIQQATDQGLIPTQVIPPDVKPIQDDLASLRRFFTS